MKRNRHHGKAICIACRKAHGKVCPNSEEERARRHCERVSAELEQYQREMYGDVEPRRRRRKQA